MLIHWLSRIVFVFLQDLLDLKGGLAILAKNLFIKYFPSFKLVLRIPHRCFLISEGLQLFKRK